MRLDFPARAALAMLSFFASTTHVRADSPLASTTPSVFFAEDAHDRAEARSLASDGRHRAFRARALRLRPATLPSTTYDAATSTSVGLTSGGTALRVTDGDGRTLDLDEALTRAGESDLAKRALFAQSMTWLVDMRLFSLAILPLLVVSLTVSLPLAVSPLSGASLLPLAIAQGAVSLSLVTGLAGFGLAGLVRSWVAVDSSDAIAAIARHNRAVAREVGLDEGEIPRAYLEVPREPRPHLAAERSPSPSSE